jgi:hypothetical protein
VPRFQSTSSSYYEVPTAGSRQVEEDVMENSRDGYGNKKEEDPAAA